MNSSIDQTFVPEHFSFMYSGINKEIPMLTISACGDYYHFTSITRLAKELDIKDDLMEFFETEQGKICIEAVQAGDVYGWNRDDEGEEDEEGEEGEGDFEGEPESNGPHPYMLVVSDESVDEDKRGVYVHPLIFEAIILWKGRKQDYIASLKYLSEW